MKNRFVLAIVALLISTAVFILVFIIAYNLACVISPPYFVEDNGEKHPVMPMGQVFLGIIFGVILGIVSLFLSYRKLKKLNIKKHESKSQDI